MFKDWITGDHLYDGENSTIYPAKHPKYEEPLVLKIARNVKSPITVIGLTKHDHDRLVLPVHVEGWNTELLELYPRVDDDKLHLKPVPFQEAYSIVYELAEGLAYLHGEGLVHKDMRPVNIFQSRANGARIFDFGWISEPHTQTHGITTLLAAVPPEGTRRGAWFDRSFDVWYLGHILEGLCYERSSGARRPRTDVPEAVIPLIDRAMQPDPKKRHPDAEAFLDDLVDAAYLGD